MGTTNMSQDVALVEHGIATLPEGWRWVQIRNAFTFTRKPRDLQISAYAQIPFVPMEVIPIGTIYFDQYVLKSQDELTSGTYFELGDVLLAKITPSFENGKQGIIEDLPTPFGIATTEVIPIRGIPGVSDKLFLFYYLLRHNIRAELAGKMEGTTGRQRLNKSTLENLEIPLPPLAEQRAIAHTLRTVQAARAARQREAALERERKAALMQRLFTQGTRGEPTKTTEIGEVPVSWEVDELAKVADIVYGVQAAVAHLKDSSVGIPILTNVNIRNDGVLDLSTLRYYDLPQHKRELLLLRKGDVLFNWRSGSQEHVGKTTIFDIDGDFTFSSFILRFRTRSGLHNHFLFYYLHWLKSEGFFVQNRQQSSVNSVFNASVAATIPVILPSFEEQRTIAEILRACDTKIAALEREAAAHDELFKALLEELMTGRVQVPGANNH